MNSVFADTAALIALGDKSDRFHHQAITVINRLKLTVKGVFHGKV